MTGENQAQSRKMSRSRSDMFARLFNVTMNSALLYSGTHPTTLKNVVSFYKDLSDLLTQHETVSLIINGNDLFIEEWPVGDAVNTSRLVRHFIKTGIYSVTFFRGLASHELEIFIKAASDRVNDVLAADISEMLLNENIKTIKINYVKFGKILSSGKKDIPGPEKAPEQTSVFQKYPGILPEKQREIEEILIAAVTGHGPENALMVIDNLKKQMDSSQPSALVSLSDTLREMKRNLEEAVEIRKINGRVAADEDSVSSKLNELSRETILKLIKEEYGGGAVSVKRLAQIIRRIVPDPNELGKLLPRIKALLTDEGMSMTDYLLLIKTINIEIDGETVAGSLGSAAEKIGVTVAEIMDAIKSEPDDAARLIFLASEIRHGGGSDQMQLSEFLAEYIEKTSKTLALEHDGTEGVHGGKALKKILFQIENQLVNKLNEFGVGADVLRSVREQLTRNFETAFDSATMDRLLTLCTGKGNRNPSELVSLISGFVEHRSQLSRIQDTFCESLLSLGFKAENIRTMISQMTGGIHPENQLVALPSGALAMNNMLFLLNREISQHKRYNTPFSTMIYTIERINPEGGKAAIAGTDEKKALIPRLFQIIKKHLRETDLLGTAGVPDGFSLFSILTMTGYDGALIVKERLLESLEKERFGFKGAKVGIGTAISITAPQNNDIKDVNTYLKIAGLNHQTGS